MKISNIETIVVRVPFKHGGPPTGFGGTVWSTLPYLLVKVDTDDGITGWGEAFGYNCIPATKAMIDSVIAPQLIGRDPTRIEPLLAELFHTLHIFGRYGVTVQEDAEQNQQIFLSVRSLAEFVEAHRVS